ncbi:hypothetical protein [Flavobacterium muglaense]|uniref:Uncharacterized protein n=1 Tax=Flavobacterium muglaense TaxID=2764716 RepID=A0A923MX95_9FLAO|nr:hypothetical protein [Flavobacterium muglaense]MBC5837480.1 hypothetical protein [Flavobacterium muglaense]MBC5844008.1 hypothetical protein [Flavobacterium muglaense]
MVVHIDNLTSYKFYKAVQGENLEFHQKERTPQDREHAPFDKTDILDKLENFGLKIKK